MNAYLQLKTNLKLCGNCRRVSFSFSPQQAQLVSSFLAHRYVEAVRKWLASTGPLRLPGTGGRIDAEKTHVIQTLRKHKAYCPVWRLQVSAVDEACYAWLPFNPCSKTAVGQLQETNEEDSSCMPKTVNQNTTSIHEAGCARSKL